MPHASVAVHVRVTPPEHPGATASVNVRLGLGSQASEAVGVLNCGELGHSTEPFGPTPLITGGVLSVTTMVRLHVDELLQSSVAVQVRVTLYS